MKRLLVLLLMIGGCADILSPMPGHPVSFAPPAEYADWYAQIEACSGLKGDFARVRWFRYPGSDIPGHAGAGEAWHDDHIIAIAETSLMIAQVVRHEIAHDILPVRGHPVEYFGVPPHYTEPGKCGSLVSWDGGTH